MAEQDHKQRSRDFNNNILCIVGIAVFGFATLNFIPFIEAAAGEYKDMVKLALQFLGGLLAIVSAVKEVYGTARENLETLSKESLNQLITTSEKILDEHRTERIFMPLNKFVEFGGIHKEVKDFPHEKLEDIGKILEPIWTSMFDRAGKQQTIRKKMSHDLTIKKVFVDHAGEEEREYELAIINHKIEYDVELKKGQPFVLAAPPLLFIVNESMNSGGVLELERQGLVMFFTPLYNDWDTVKHDISKKLKDSSNWGGFERIQIDVVDKTQTNKNLDAWKKVITIDPTSRKKCFSYQRYTCKGDSDQTFTGKFNALIKFFDAKYKSIDDSKENEWKKTLEDWNNAGSILSIVLPELEENLVNPMPFDSQRVRINYDMTYPLVIRSGLYTEYTYALPLENISTLEEASMKLDNITGKESPTGKYKMLPVLLLHPLRSWTYESSEILAKVKSASSYEPIVPGNGIIFSWKSKE